jgi:hypothetical protein
VVAAPRFARRWFAVHAFSIVLTETRLLLVPLVLVVLPGCLLMMPAREYGAFCRMFVQLSVAEGLCG